MNEKEGEIKTDYDNEERKIEVKPKKEEGKENRRKELERKRGKNVM